MQAPTDERIQWRDLDISAITTVDECQAFVLRCMRDLHNVQESITRRQDDAEAGEEIDLGKLRAMQAALKGLGRTHQALNFHLGKLGRQERAARGGQSVQAVDSDMLKAFEREHDNAQRWAGDLECIMQDLGVGCARVNDARVTIQARLLDLTVDLLTAADAAPMTAQATMMYRVATALAPKDSGQSGKTFEAHFLAVVQESVDEAVFLDWRREAEKRGAL